MNPTKNTNRPLYFLSKVSFCALFLALGMGVFYRMTYEEQGRPVVLKGTTMGTYYVITYFPHRGLNSSPSELKSLVERDLEEVNRQMSTYIPSSEISRFNQLQADESFKISPWFSQVLEFSLGLAEQSKGAFDPTVGPLVNRLGFGPSEGSPPVNSQETAEVLSYVGYSKITLEEEGHLRKSHPRVYLDLSAVAKGFAVDVLSDRMSSLGLRNHLVEIGGEIKASGRKPGGKKWVIGIENPSSTRSIQSLLALDGNAIATSGVYRNFKETEKGTIAHTINPKTGESRINRLVSVSVLATECMKADALATTLLVMGEEAGPRFAKQHGIAALFLIKKEKKEGVETVMTGAFRPALVEDT